MRLMSSSVLRLAICAGLCGLGFLSPARADDDASCKALETAILANSKAPYHSYTKIQFTYAAMMTVAHRNLKLPEEQQSETIFTGDAVFIRLVPRKWQAMPGTVAQFQASIKDSVTGLKDCKSFPDEKVDGVDAKVFQGSASPQNRLVQTKVWVGPEGLPLKSETDIEVGHSPGGDMVHQHLTTRYEHGKIEAPSLTQ
ncbi:MAG TPA: hypothetical protein VL492_04910 [Methylovirgula sp.]|nr:hypothetical protein [Methylovirgula sp.]